MRTSKCVAAVVIAVALGMAGLSVKAEQGNAPQPAAPSNTRGANCIVRITADPEVVPLNGDTVMALLHNSAVEGKAIRDVLGTELPREAQGMITIPWLRPDELARGPQTPLVPHLYNPPVPLNSAEPNRPEEPNRLPRPEIPGSGTPVYPYGGTYDAVDRDEGMSMVPYGATPGPQIGQAMEQSVTFELTIRLPDNVKPAAEELMTAVIGNLRKCLIDAYDWHAAQLETFLNTLDSQRFTMTARLSRYTRTSSGTQIPVDEQLDGIVDLTYLTPQTPLAEAIEAMRRAVEPILNITVLWTDLREHLNIDPTTQINIDGMPHVRLRTALDLLVQGLPANDVKVVWTIRDGVVVIGTTAALREPGRPADGAKVNVDVRALMAQRNDLTRRLQQLDVEMAGMEARRRAIAEQIERTRREADIRLADDPVTRELEKLVAANTESLAQLQKQVESGRASAMDLAQANENLTRAKIELAKRREELSRQVGGGQLEPFTGEMVRMSVDNAERQAQMEVLRRQLGQTQAQLAEASRFDPEAARIRGVREALGVMDRRIAELQTHIATLQPPTVTVIGMERPKVRER